MKRLVRAIARAIQGPRKTRRDNEDHRVGSNVTRPRILCLDDNPRVLRLLRRQLGAMYEVVITQSAEEALSIIATVHTFDVIVSDLEMPGTHGLSFLKQAREISPTTESIILTGLSDPATMAVARSAGKSAQLLTKPWSEAALMEAIDRAVRRHQSAMPIP